ncbi:MAG: hypothetical protein ACXWM7_07875, partial [Parachlamydiaceae bacterium]
AFTEEDLIEEHGDFIGAALQYILHCEFSDSASVREASNTLIPFIKLSGGIDDQFATLFLTVPILKKRYNIYTRLFKNIQVDSSKVLLMTWKTIFFIQSIKEFNEQTIHDVHQIAFRIQNKTVQADLFRGLLELTLNWIEEIVSQQTLSDGDVGRLKSLTTSLDEQLKALSQIVTGKPFELTMVGKIIHCLKILLAQQDRSSAIQEIVATIKNYLPDYVLILFSSLNLKSIAEHCRHLTFLKSLGLSLSSIFSEKTIQPLTEEMDKCLEEVKKTGETTSCIKSLEKVDYILQHFLRILIIVDFVAPAYREKYLEVLPELYKSRSASFFYKDYTKEERKKLLLWLESLAQRDELFQYEEWIRDFCKELRNSIYDFQNGLSGIPKNSAISFCESDSENRPLSKFALVEKKDNFCADLPGNFEGISKDMAEKLNVKDVKNCHFNEQMEFQKRPNEPSSRLNDFMIAESLSNFLSPTSSEKSLSNSIPSFFEDRQLDEKEIARYLWLNPDTLISPSTLRKVNKVSVYLRRKRLELRGVKADGNCFCYAFLGSYETLNRKIPILDEQKDKISYLRDIIAQEYAITEKGSDYKGRQRVEGIKEDKEWLTGDEGDLLAISLSIPIRIITINEEKGHSQIFDMLTFTEKNKDRQEWKTIPESEKPKEYITIVDLGGHFVYAVPCSTDLNSENAQREKLQSSY